MASDGDYSVGYKKPPREHQWKPGQSGNPKGRPKKVRDFEKLFERELDTVVSITEHGQVRQVPKRDLIVKSLITRAIKGDFRALKLVITFMQANQGGDDFEFDAEDRAMLEALMRRGQDEEGADG